MVINIVLQLLIFGSKLSQSFLLFCAYFNKSKGEGKAFRHFDMNRKVCFKQVLC